MNCARPEAVIAQAFVDFVDQGYVYKGLKPVNWCIRDRTALAEAEVEYENHTSPSIWVRLALLSDPAAIDPAAARTLVMMAQEFDQAEGSAPNKPASSVS